MGALRTKNMHFETEELASSERSSHRFSTFHSLVSDAKSEPLDAMINPQREKRLHVLSLRRKPQSNSSDVY